MQKSIKKLLSVALTLAVVMSLIPAVVFAADITPISTSTPAIYVGVGTSTGTNYDKTVTSKAVAENDNGGLRPYVNVSKSGSTTDAYDYSTYLVWTADVDILNRVETNTVTTNTYARIYFNGTYAVNLSLDALGKTGDTYKLTVIVTPDKDVYVYCNNKLYKKSNASLPVSFNQIRYYEVGAVNSGENNILRFYNPALTHYASDCALDDVLALHETKVVGKTSNTIRTNYGTASGNTFTSVTKAGGNGGWGIWVQCGFESKLIPGRNIIYVEGSIKVDKRVATTPRAENCPITLSFEGTQASNTANIRRQYFNINCRMLEEGNEYPLIIIIDESNKAHVWINDTYTELQLSGHADYQRISYCEGGVVTEGEGNVFTIEPFDYTVYPKGTDLGIFIDNVELSDNNALFAGNTLIDEDVDLSKVTDKDGNKNLTENTSFILAASKFNTSLLTVPETLEYGMVISDEELTEELTVENGFKAEAVRNSNGSYGILLYGNRIVAGKTYYIRPYLYYNNNYIYGTTQTIEN